MVLQKKGNTVPCREMDTGSGAAILAGEGQAEKPRRSRGQQGRPLLSIFYKASVYREKLAPLLIIPSQAHYPEALDALQSFTLMLW